MEILNIENYKEKGFNTAIALGNFDGVHMGHQKLILEMIKIALDLNLKSSVLIFENHTKLTIEGKGPKLLNSLKQKHSLIEKLGVETIYTMQFNEEIMKLSPEEFVKSILIDKLNIKAVIVGNDYRFGHKASGDSNLLKTLGVKYGFYVKIVEPVYINDVIISSTKIRELLSNGDLDEAKLLLGRDYSLFGKVVSGKRIGNSLGFPTANLEPIENYIIPKNGVYSTKTIVDGKRYLSATSVGYNPTFDEKALKIESHILNFNEDLYGEVIELVFIKYLRPELKFNNLELLKKQIDKDIFEIKRH